MFRVDDRVVWVSNDQTPHLGTVTEVVTVQTHSRGLERRAVVHWDNSSTGVWTTQELFTSIFTVAEYNARTGTELE